MIESNSPDNFDPESVKIIADILAGDYRSVHGLYDDLRGGFLKWAKKNFYSIERYGEDAYQDAFIIFYEQVKSRKIKGLRCKVKTYLFAIGYRLLLKRNRKEWPIVWKSEFDKEVRGVGVIFEDPWEEEKLIVQEAMKKLSPKCQELLAKRYYLDLTIKELSEEYEKNNNNVSSQLSQCLDKLIAVIKDREKDERK